MHIYTKHLLNSLFLFLVVGIGWGQCNQTTNTKKQYCENDTLRIKFPFNLDTITSLKTEISLNEFGDKTSYDISNSFDLSFISGLSKMTIIPEDTSYIGFITGFSYLYKLKLSSNLSKVKSIDSISYIGNSRANDVKFYQNNNKKWNALISFINGKRIAHYSFDSLTNLNPVIDYHYQTNSSTVNFSNPIYFPKGDSTLIGVIGSITQKFHFINPNTNKKHEINLPSLTGIQVYQECGIWYGIGCFLNSHKLYRITWGTNILNPNPTIKDIESFKSPFLGPTNCELINNGGNITLYVSTNRATKFYKGSFGKSILNEPTFTTIVPQNRTIGNSNSITIINNNNNNYLVHLGGSDPKLHIIDKNCTTLYPEVINDTSIRLISEGEFILKTTITNQKNIKELFIDTIKVHKNPSILISFRKTCNYDSTIFISESLSKNGQIISTNWQINSSNYLGDSGSTKFSNEGTFPFSISVTDSIKCTSVLDSSLYINKKADFIPSFISPLPICSNQEIKFINSSTYTIDSIINYKWLFDNNDSSELINGITTYKSPDTLFPQLIAIGKSGCSQFISKQISIIKGPQINFSANEECLNDSTQFTNLTTGENITGYKWYFGNGDTSLQTSPSVLFDTAKIFNIRLEASNQAGCNNSLDTTYQIHPLPTIDFDNGLNCSNTTTDFYNRSSIPTDSIRSYTWKLNNDSVSSDKDPQIVMVNSRTNFIKLISESSFGCKDSLTKALTTIQSPQITIDTEEDCFGKPTKFSDNSTDIATITERNWSIKDLEPTSISTTFSHTFENADTFTVYLSLTSSTGCSSIDSTTINIAPLPQPTFITSQLCLDDSVQFINTSQVIGGDSIKSVRWFFESAGFEQGDSVNVKFSQQGTENIIVELLTKNGCSSNTSSSVEILQSANADFTLNKSIGTAPLTVQATSLENNNTHTWIIANNDTLRTENITTTYDTNNTYQLIHITQNSDGCIDSVTKSIIVGNHLFDLAIQGVGIKDSVNNSYITVLLHNYSPFPISAPALDIDINNEIKLHTTINTTLPPNTSTSMDIPIGISSNNLNNSNYICVAIDTNSIQDFVNDNNELCLSLNEKIDISMPMPNPTTDYINFNIYSPSNQSAEITIYNTLGNKIKRHTVQLTVGNNTITEDLSNFSNEVYIIDVNSNNIHQKVTITKY